MKTILIPISARQQARNILRTRAFGRLRQNRDIQIVVLVPRFKRDEYEREFSDTRIIWEGVDVPTPLSRLDVLFGRLALFYINSPTAQFLRKQWLLFERKSPLRYVASRTMLFVLGSSTLLKKMLRYLDYVLIKDERFKNIFSKHTPDLVFLPRIDLPLDTSVLRHAKRRSIKSIGMISSWDNITLPKYPFRLLPDKLIVHNEILEREAIRYLDFRSEDIFVCGLPHFDHYVSGKRSSREAFCKRVGIDSSKSLILFASVGAGLNPTEWQVLQLLSDAVRDGRLPENITFLARHHPAQQMNPGKLKPSPCIIFDDSKTALRSQEVKYTEILARDMNHLADSLYHTEMTVSTASTMTIDAAAFDKPSINIGFDGWEEKPFHKSARRFYEPNHDHYQAIVKSGGTRIAYSLDELIGYIHIYLNNPSIDREGRKRIVREQCYKFDGKSGERIANYILAAL